MKDKENIKNINKLSISYMMLSGLKGKALENNNPFLKYLTYNMLMDSFNKEKDISSTESKLIYIINEKSGLNSNYNIIPTNLVHDIIEESYNMYKNLDNKSFDKKINDDISNYLDNDYDNFIDDLYDKYIESFLNILLNYNSKRETYNIIKKSVFNDELEKSVKIEDYDKAIFYRDKIKELVIKMELIKKESEI